jgi:hypothetical protein
MVENPLMVQTFLKFTEIVKVKKSQSRIQNKEYYTLCRDIRLYDDKCDNCVGIGATIINE